MKSWNRHDNQTGSPFFPVSFIRFAALIWVALPCISNAATGLIRPGAAEGHPTDVFVTMALLDVDDIDSASQNFVANLYVQVEWKDPELAEEGAGERVVPLTDIWNPRIIFVNRQKIFHTYPDVATIQPDGTVVVRQRVWGSFSQPLDVQDFPFDTQEFEMRLAATGYGLEEITFLPHPQLNSGLADSFSLPDWEILNWRLSVDPYRPTELMKGVPSFALVFRAKRYASSFVIKVIIPLFLIVCMSGIVFWIDPRESGTQIGVATTSMLTLIAYRFMVGNSLPPVPYLTKMDYFILGSTLLVFTALVQSVITSILARNSRVETAKKLDVWCRWIYGILVLLVAVVSLMA